MQQKSILDLMLQAMEKSFDVALFYQFQKDMIKQSLLDREERQMLINDVANEVMSRITIKLDDTAIKELRDQIESLKHI